MTGVDVAGSGIDPAPLQPSALHLALSEIEGWSQPSTIEATGAHHGYRQVRLVGAGRTHPRADPFRFALDQFAPIHSAWLSWIDPGGFIVPHRDGGPYRERWQLPIHAAGTFTDDTGTTRHADGVPFRVRQWLPHSVTNDTDGPRVHLVIDRDVLLSIPYRPFTLE